MRLTIGRWVATILASCALVAVILLPIPRATKPLWFGQAPRELASSVAALTAAAGALNDAVRTYRVAQGLARWNASERAAPVLIDASIPAPVAGLMRAIAQEQWRRVGSSASASRASVFVYFDSTTIAGVASPNAPRRTADPHRPVDVWYALPEMTDGDRCVVLVRIRTTNETQLASLRDRSLLGPCAYFAAFGQPGPAVHRWLQATNYRAARVPDWDTPRAAVLDPSALYTLDQRARQCLTGVPHGCAAALGINASPTMSIRLVDGNSLDETRRQTLALGEASPRFLADVVRELGQPRFAQFWASADSLESAFAIAAQVPLDRWAAQWLERNYGPRRQRPGVQRQDLLWVAIVLPLLVVVAARARSHVAGR